MDITANQIGDNNLNNDIKVSKAAEAYKNMGQYNYEFIITKNRNSPKIKIVLDFDLSKFYHLCGLHDLKIDTIQLLSRKAIFDRINDGTYKDELFQKSENFSQITDRITCLIRLEEMLDSNDTVFKYNLHKKGTCLECDYIIKNTKDNRNYYYMISIGSNGNYFGRSCFNRDAITQEDFSNGHSLYYILYKAKLTVDKKGQEIDRKELFVADSFRRELEEMKKASEIATELQSPSAEFKKKKTDFSLLPERNENSFSFAPLCYSAGALAAVLPDSNRYNPLGELLKNVIAGLSDVSKKITEFLTAPLPSVHIGERKQPSQARKPSERKINYNIPFAKQTPSDERSEPSAAKPERRSSWIDKMLSSAKREADENNSKHKIKSHDKDKSL